MILNMGQMLAKLKQDKELADLRKIIAECNEQQAQIDALRKRLGVKSGESLIKAMK